MRAVFIAGTDTGAGKTVVTECLARYCAEDGMDAVIQKWVETGCGPARRPSDAAPYLFKKACSPHLASALEGVRIDPRRIIRSFKTLARRHDVVIVEGTGGVLVPTDGKRLLVDIAARLRLPAVVVAANRLGAINHTLLTIEALRKRKIPLVGIVFDQVGPEDAAILRDNPRIIARHSGAPVLGSLPYARSRKERYRRFRPIAAKIMRRMAHG